MQPKTLEQHPLTICFRILEKLGKPGEYVWESGKKVDGLPGRLAYLTDSIAWLREKSKEGIWQTLPVDFRTFVESDRLLKKRGVLWPEVIRCGAEINSGKYVEAVLTGGIGVAKTTLAIYTQAYQLYTLSCLENPHRLFDLDPSSEILIVFQSINKNLAQDVDYKRFRDMVKGSPYFNSEFAFDTGRESDMRFPRNIAVKPVAGHDAAAIGQNVIGGIIDEYLVGRTQVITPVGNRNLKDVEPGDLVLAASAKGEYLWDRVVKQARTGAKQVFQLTLDDGKVIVGSVDHPIATTDGWVGLGRLRPGQEVYIAGPERPREIRPVESTAAQPAKAQAFGRDGTENSSDESENAAGGEPGIRATTAHQIVCIGKACRQQGAIAQNARIGPEHEFDRCDTKEALGGERATMGKPEGRRITSNYETRRSCPCSAFENWVEKVCSNARAAIDRSDRVHERRGKAGLQFGVLAPQDDAGHCNSAIHLGIGIRESTGGGPGGPSVLLRASQNSVSGRECLALDVAGLLDHVQGRPTLPCRGEADVSGVSRAHKNASDVEPCPEMWMGVPDAYRARVVAVRPLGVEEVYNLETELTHTFVANGIVTHNCNFMAVVENSKATKDGSVYDQATQNYNSIARRRESRFMQMGTLPGMLCLVSSRNYPGQFTDKKEAEARKQIQDKGRSTIYVYDKRIWELRPERFSGDKFRTFIGDDTRKPRILEENETVAADDSHLVMAIPVEYRQTFDNDLLAALRDVAGVATMALHPYMLNTEAVAACFGKVLSIASRDDCDFKSTKLQLYPKRIQNPLEPRFAHIDLALSKDSAGISIGHVPEFRTIDRGSGLSEVLPVIQFDMILEVRPPRGGEIEFENIRKLLYLLRDTLHLPLKWVSFDQYQSRDSMQILHREGFLVGYQSMDVDTDAYDVTKQAFYDQRLLAPAQPRAQKEMITLEFDPQKQKIDHPPNGSKDVSDSMAGVVYGLTMRREIWVRHKIPIHKIPQLKTSKGQTKDSLSAKELAAAKPKTYMQAVRESRQGA